MSSILLITGLGVGTGSVATDLVAMGHEVTITTATDATNLDLVWGTGKDLILLMATTSDGPAPWVKAKWQAGARVIFGSNWAASIYPVLYGLATGTGEGSVSSYAVDISVTPHPISTGFSGNVAVTSTTAYAQYNHTGVKGVTVGTRSGAVSLSAFDVGESLHAGATQSPGATSPARAVWMGWLQRDATLTLAGRTILGQAVSWALTTSGASAISSFIGWGAPRVEAQSVPGANVSPVWVVETQRTVVGVTGPATLTFASTPQPGDVIAVQYACHRSSSVRILSTITGMGGTWSQAFNSGVGQSTWVGTGATAAGAITLTQNAAASMTAEARLIRGLTSSVASGVWADLTGGAASTLSRTAGRGQIVLGYFHGFDAALAPTTYPVSTVPTSGWVFTTQVDDGTLGWRSGLFIPGDAAATRSVVADSTGSGDTVQHSLVVLGTAV